MQSKSAPARVLVVDDDPEERLDVTRMVEASGYVAVTSENGEEALEKLGTSQIDAIVTDLMMPRMDGFTLLRTLLERGDPTPAVVLTGFGSIREAIAIVRDLRAFWFLEKPAQQLVLGPLLERAIQHRRLLAEAETLGRQLNRQGLFEDMIGSCEPMRRVFSTIRQVAGTSASVLITGESGTGKERVAAAIHKLSPRAARPFVAINCAAFPESLIESELFGHERGAFTGAEGRQAGCFELADRGTLFLDEIAEMPLPMQAKLLRVLEDSKVRRLGGQNEISVDVRVLAATNRPVKEAIQDKLLREDLYYRLNVVHIALPPLRHRKEDIPALAEGLIRLLNERNDCRVTGIDPQTLVSLMERPWPGNVRELKNVLERAVIMAHEGVLMPEHLQPSFASVRGMQQQATAAADDAFIAPPGRPLREVEDAYIRHTLQRNNFNRARAAEILGIALRTLSKRLGDSVEADSSGPENQDAASAGSGK